MYQLYLLAACLRKSSLEDLVGSITTWKDITRRSLSIFSSFLSRVILTGWPWLPVFWSIPALYSVSFAHSKHEYLPRSSFCSRSFTFCLSVVYSLLRILFLDSYCKSGRYVNSGFASRGSRASTSPEKVTTFPRSEMLQRESTVNRISMGNMLCLEIQCPHS